ncbi:MAG: GxxExxY protein [Candidatus Marinimicrobia bacterium]|nr:GxxExxY protein [Candidatus Neomarinimicrobiota bacterium]
MMHSKLLYPELSYKIIGLAIDVHNRVGSGFPEKLYEKALMILFKKNGIQAQNQVHFNVIFEEENIGKFIADIVVENKIILELKSVKELNNVHKIQTINYLKATGMKLGILLNYGEEKLKSERLINLETQMSQTNSQ